MRRLNIIPLLLALAAVLVVSATALADVPPPPANQNLGLFDATVDFSGPNVNRDFCSQVSCHPGSQVDRHHALINSENLGCLDCHVLEEGAGGFVFQDFRECTNCHMQSPHHSAPDAAARHCSACHGSFVDDFDDGHFIPDYPGSSVTPGTSGTLLDTGQYAGGCRTCHQANAAQGIASNSSTHHGTGLAFDPALPGDCNWCHGGTDPFGNESENNIRRCQECHGVLSLHNIQADSNGDGQVVPGEELGGYGHIGANPDCFGCHINTAFPYSTFEDSPTVPSISSLSSQVVTAGEQVELILVGESLTNTSGTTTFAPRIVLSQDGKDIVLYPVTFDADQLSFLVPGDLAPGNYDLRVWKDDVKSNKAVLTLSAPIAIAEARVSNEIVAITGSGFSGPSGQVVINQQPGQVISWQQGLIRALVPGAAPGREVIVVTAKGAVAKAALAEGTSLPQKERRLKRLAEQRSRLAILKAAKGASE